MKKNIIRLTSALVIISATAGISTIATGDVKAAGNIPDTHSATVQIAVDSAMCSGVYVGPQTVLTVKHCVGNTKTIRVASHHLYSSPTTPGELVWLAPGDIDLALVRTPQQTVDYYSPISPTKPTSGQVGQMCGMNKVPDHNTGVVTERAGSNYCGNITFREIKNYRYGNQHWGELILVSPSLGFPGDSGGPVYDTSGTVHGVLALRWDRQPNDSNPNHYLYDRAAFTPTFKYVNELRAHGAVVKGEEPESYQHQQAEQAIIADGTYVITSALDNNKALDVNGESRLNGANVQLWDRNNGKAQRFKVTHLGHNVYSIINVHSNKSLDIAGSSRSAGGNLLQWTWKNTDNQKFHITKTTQGGYAITSVHSGLLLDVYSSQTANGTNVAQWTNNGGYANQRWNFNPQ